MFKSLLKDISGTICIEFSEDQSEIKSINWNDNLAYYKFNDYDDDDYSYVDDMGPIEDILDRVEYPESTIIISTDYDGTNDASHMIYKSSGGFTVRNLLDIIIKVERVTRPTSGFFGGVDVDHIYFEGIHEISRGVYRIYWGS